jgi:tetratricopeptide (TPR) repeat protein
MTTDMPAFQKLKPPGLHVLIGLLLLLMPFYRLNGQDDKLQTRILWELDSMYRLLYEFNFTNEELNGQAYKDYPGIMDRLAEKSMTIGFDQGYFKSQNTLFLYYKYADDLANAFGVLDGAIAKAEAGGMAKYVAQFTYLKGTQFHRYNEFDSSLLYFERAYDMGEQIGNRPVMASAINAMAATYGKLRRYDESLIYYRKALPIAIASQDSTLISLLLGNMGLAFGRLEQADSAYVYGLQNLQMAEASQDPKDMRQALNVLTIASYLKGDYTAALSYSDQLYKQVEQSKDWGYLVTPYLYRAKSWKALGNIEKALVAVNRSIDIAREIAYVSGEINSLEWLINLNEERGAYESAFRQMERLTVLRDDEKEREATGQLERMTLRYELKEKESSLKNLQEVQKITAAKIRFRNLMITSLVLAFLIIVWFTVWIYRKRVEQERMQAQESQNKLLRSQLNPHFLFNALSSIQLFMINKGQGPEALEYLSKFARLMRRILENSRESFVSLEDEITTLRHYLDLQKIRFDNKFEYNIDVSTHHDLEDITIPPMFAQPFIENSLEHGIASRNHGVINVWFEESGGSLHFRVEDNGVGISRSTTTQSAAAHKSLATAITKDRIALLKKQLKRKISFAVRDKHDASNQVTGTEVIFELPIMYRYS